MSRNKGSPSRRRRSAQGPSGSRLDATWRNSVTSFARRVRSATGRNEKSVLVESGDRAGVSQRVDLRSARSIASASSLGESTTACGAGSLAAIPHVDPEFAVTPCAFLRDGIRIGVSPSIPSIPGACDRSPRSFRPARRGLLSFRTGGLIRIRLSCDAFSASSAWPRRQPRSAAPLRPAGG